MRERIPATTRLAAGQALHMLAPAGMTIIAMDGSIHIRGTTRWMAGQPVEPSIALQEGEAHQVQDTGWIAVSASDRAEVACLAPGSGLTLPLGLLRTLRSWLVGRWALLIDAHEHH